MGENWVKDKIGVQHNSKNLVLVAANIFDKFQDTIQILKRIVTSYMDMVKKTSKFADPNSKDYKKGM